MALYRVTLKNSVGKDLKRVDRWQVLRILKVIKALETNPFPPSSKKLVGSEYTYRVRVGDFRIIYTVDYKSREVEIQRVGHRKEIYR